jgi:NADH dehydrogenase/NADH:ubiquinone oxidoreductase subunit G
LKDLSEKTMIEITVDNRQIQAEEGLSVLEACLRNDIYIPNLCFLKEMDHPPASCRLCFVEIEGANAPETSCTKIIRTGMVIRTDSLKIRALQRSALELLLSVHDVDCGHCAANKQCELQKIARFLKVGLKPKHLDLLFEKNDPVEVYPGVFYFRNRCVLCGRCIHVCAAQNGRPLMAFAKRGFHTEISFSRKENSSGRDCTRCLHCVEACPVGALMVEDGG